MNQGIVNRISTDIVAAVVVENLLSRPVELVQVAAVLRVGRNTQRDGGLQLPVAGPDFRLLD